MDVQEIKQRFGIIGNSPLLNRAIDIARQVAPTDISVLVTGESGSGKEAFSHVLHNLSHRKHGPFIAVNCGAIPEGTVDSELFGHVKGSFTNAVDDRKGYFEVVNGGTIFLDEVAELPLGTQARLLRILETGEYLRVGSSKVQKTDVRIVAATNVDVFEAVQKGKFREDLYYRLNTVPLRIPSLRERKEDIYLLFRKFVSDFSEKYRSPSIQLTEDARQVLEAYPWPGNVRQLRNLAEQIAVLEKNREVDALTLRHYLPVEQSTTLPMIRKDDQQTNDFSERDILYKVLFDMKKDISDLKKLVVEIIQHPESMGHVIQSNAQLVTKLYQDVQPLDNDIVQPAINLQPVTVSPTPQPQYHPINFAEEVEESLSLNDQEADLIKKALKKHKGKRKYAASELGISERTLYRKIKELNL
ncbi:sigma-54-dependent Fis family transcriptional regulator [Solitalea canadensis]|uniref:Response regulator with CheY-like receiver, AAA-type ATPase, and DNA-binding domains n=1 Tax=Solitalea canadensis (strain ATCC 29591 / DSM 3403 / JCM 21819 / LMG 8368 / NBRC 15130 / NCIMB 12057 / USAM 9D) TaxID=929556 RepID=H8KMY2_SOLCM|nr:sigma-54-dependent Fis family transcriptional regulator [Solitalea canadensis]AFD09061.1 response regulator with CheY-like receiver, AAA-type ATPase, and DNA-binding domains [Solitalea canadensis DSM 3403]